MSKKTPEKSSTKGAPSENSIFSSGSLMPSLGHRNNANKPQLPKEKMPVSDIMIKSNSRAKLISSTSRTGRLANAKSLIKQIPMLREVAPSEYYNNFIQKLELCSIVCDFTYVDSAPAVAQDVQLKSQYLKDIIGYVCNSIEGGKSIPPTGDKIVIFPESCWAPLLRMVSLNIFRCLPTPEWTPVQGTDLDEEEPQTDPSWPHLQPVYELLFRFILSNDVDPKQAVRYFTTDFIQSLIMLFDSSDTRERDALKSTLHRIYSRFWPRRPFIRNAISNVFKRLVYEHILFNGVAELLEILGSIIHGFGVPIKQEHLLFLTQTLLPLHKATRVSQFHLQLSNCMILFLEKDPTLVRLVVTTLIHYWPKASTQKQILFIAEIEDIIDFLTTEDLVPIASVLFGRLSECITSTHFQVAERALSVLSNDNTLHLVQQTKETSINTLFMALYTNTKSHWSSSIVSLTFSALKLFMNMDAKLFSMCAANFKKKQNEEHQTKVIVEQTWGFIERLAQFNAQKFSQIPKFANNPLVITCLTTTLRSTRSSLTNMSNRSFASSPHPSTSSSSSHTSTVQSGSTSPLTTPTSTRPAVVKSSASPGPVTPPPRASSTSSSSTINSTTSSSSSSSTTTSSTSLPSTSSSSRSSPLPPTGATAATANKQQQQQRQPSPLQPISSRQRPPSPSTSSTSSNPSSSRQRPASPNTSSSSSSPSSSSSSSSSIPSSSRQRPPSPGMSSSSSSSSSSRAGGGGGGSTRAQIFNIPGGGGGGGGGLKK